MKNFLTYISETNSIGTAFEKKTAQSINAWLKHVGLDNKFKAEKYQSLNENIKCEEFSDIIIKNLNEAPLFFIECKEYERANILNSKFNITSDGDITPVRGKEKTELSETELDLYSNLTKAIRQSEQFKQFIDFLNDDCIILKNKKPAEFWNNKSNDIDSILSSLIKDYNKCIKSGNFEADCKSFDIKNIRSSTKNILVCALAWRLSDLDRTWDICTVKGNYGFGKLICNHYSNVKKIPAEYIQIGDDKLFAISDNNPFNIKNIEKFPSDIECKFTIKFTPRFGTGSIYLTPRSEIISEFKSDLSFINKKKWPEI